MSSLSSSQAGDLILKRVEVKISEDEDVKGYRGIGNGNGCTFFDTAEVYSPNLSGIGHNELIAGNRDMREYVREEKYDEAIFIEDIDTVVIHDIKSGYTNRCPISDVCYLQKR